MARLFIGNFDFEHRLAQPARQISSKLERINAELATSWLAIAAAFFTVIGLAGEEAVQAIWKWAAGLFGG